MTMRWRTLRSLVAVSVIAFPTAVCAQSSAAHSLANKFASDSDASQKSKTKDDRLALDRKQEQPTPEDEARLKADEADMLERAKAEADERRKADELADDKAARERSAREAARIKQADKLLLAHEKDDADRKAAEAETSRAAEAQRLAAERQDAERRDTERKAAERKAADAEKVRLAEKAEAERRAAEAETRRIAEDRAIAERKAAEAEATRLAVRAEKKRLEAAEAERRRIAADRAEADRVAAASARKRIDEAKQADAQRRMEAEREDEARRLSEKLTRAREQRAAAKELGDGYSALGNPPPADALTNTELRADHGRTVRESRATILLVLEPGSRGIRRYEKTADPIICVGATCYVGSGGDQAAVSMTRGRAFGPGNTLGQRAGACRHSLTCVFRDVDTGSGRFEVQPIDLRILRHDRRETIAVETDSSCTATRGQLQCTRTVQAGSYRIWVVPESVARKAGDSALQAALAAGLPSAHANLER